MNKKGFTLIELLAVIVILAVIALIATPVIMNAISNAKQGAFKDAAYGIIKATENVYAKGFSETTEPVDTFFLYENGVMTSYPSGKTIDYKGSVPQDGGIVLHADGSITLAIHGGVNCAVKTKTASTVSISTTDKATCISNIYYKQASAPFTNFVTNGDFSNGTLGWNQSNSNNYVQSGVLTNIPDGSARYGYAYPIWTKNPTNIYYVVGDARVLNTNSNPLALMRVGPTIYIDYPIINKWYILKGYGTIAADKPSFAFIHYYVDNQSAVGKEMEIRNVIGIDLTSTYGAGTEPTKDQMDNNLNKVWIDSTNNTPKRFTAGGWINF